MCLWPAQFSHSGSGSDTSIKYVSQYLYTHNIDDFFRAIRTISAECLKSKYLFKVSRHEGIHFLTIRNFTFIQLFFSTTKFVWCVRYNSICARLFLTFESSPQSRCCYRVNEVHSWFSLKLRVWLQFAFLSFFNSVLTTHFCVLWFTKKQRLYVVVEAKWLAVSYSRAFKTSIESVRNGNFTAPNIYHQIYARRRALQKM